MQQRLKLSIQTMKLLQSTDFFLFLVCCAEGIYIFKEKLKFINFNLFSMRVITIQKYKLNVKFRFKIFQLLRIS